MYCIKIWELVHFAVHDVAFVFKDITDLFGKFLYASKSLSREKRAPESSVPVVSLPGIGMSRLQQQVDD